MTVPAILNLLSIVVNMETQSIYLTFRISVIVSLIVFFSGLCGIFIFRRNLINILVAIELLLLGCSLFFIFFSFYLNDIVGQIFALYIITVAAAESSIALALLTVYYRLSGHIAIDSGESMSLLKG